MTRYCPNCDDPLTECAHRKGPALECRRCSIIWIGNRRFGCPTFPVGDAARQAAWDQIRMRHGLQ